MMNGAKSGSPSGGSQAPSPNLPLLGERAGVRGKEANSNPRLTTTPGAGKLRESPVRAGGFAIWL